MSTNPLQFFEPTDEPLLSLLFEQVDDLMLRDIARADYGESVEKHLKALVEIKNGKVLSPTEWEPKEVLELYRWSEPEDSTWKPGSVGTRGHWMRLFSCTVLIRSAVEPGNEIYFTGEDSTIIQLVASALSLGSQASLAAMQFLSWRMNNQSKDEEDCVYTAIAILLLAVSLNKCSAEAFRYLIIVCNSLDELTISELFSYPLKSQTWNKLTRRILLDSIELQDVELLSEIKALSLKLLADSSAE